MIAKGRHVNIEQSLRLILCQYCNSNEEEDEYQFYSLSILERHETKIFFPWQNVHKFNANKSTDYIKEISLVSY